MSYRATNWAYELPLKGSAKPVLVALADLADESDSCFPGQARLSEMTGLSERTVRRALERLDEWGLIERQARHDSRGYRTSDRYVLSVGYQPDTLTTGQDDHRSLCHDLPDTVSTPTGHSDRAIEPLVEPLVEPSDTSPEPVAPAPDPVEELFDRLWDLWPSRRRGTRKKSGASFRTALKAVGGRRKAAVIFDAAERHAGVWGSWPESDKKFIPEMTTWLNQERWTGVDPEPRGNVTPIRREIPKNDEWMYR